MQPDSAQAEHDTLDPVGTGQAPNPGRPQGRAAAQPMHRDETADASAMRALPTRTAGAAAQCIDLHRFRQLVDSPPLLHAQGLRVASRWPLSGGVQMPVCAPAPRFIETLQNRPDCRDARRRAP